MAIPSHLLTKARPFSRRPLKAFHLLVSPLKPPHAARKKNLEIYGPFFSVSTCGKKYSVRPCCNVKRCTQQSCFFTLPNPREGRSPYCRASHIHHSSNNISKKDCTAEKQPLNSNEKRQRDARCVFLSESCSLPYISAQCPYGLPQRQKPFFPLQGVMSPVQL